MCSVPSEIVKGCPENIANKIPPMALSISISMTPIWFLVHAFVKDLKTMALARAAIKRKTVEPKVLKLRPSE